MDENLLRFRKGVKYAFLDFETYNLCLHFKQNRFWQMGLLEVLDERIIHSHDIYVLWHDCPHLQVGKEAAAITRYDKQKHQNIGITPEGAAKILWPILSGADHIIMHNGLRFDLFLIKGFAEYLKVDWKWVMPKIIDTKSIAQGVKMGIPYNPEKESFLDYQYKLANCHVKGVKTRLEILGKEYGIDHDYENLHDAVNDLTLNLKVWNKLKYQLNY